MSWKIQICKAKTSCSILGGDKEWCTSSMMPILVVEEFIVNLEVSNHKIGDNLARVSSISFSIDCDVAPRELAHPRAWIQEK